MKELRENQIVACWDGVDENRFIRIFVKKRKVRNRGVFFECRPPEGAKGMIGVEIWENCTPLEDIEPDAFLAREKDAPQT